MGTVFDVGEIASVPPAGKRSLLLDANGDPYLLDEDGVHHAFSGTPADDSITAAMLSTGDKAAITAFMNSATNALPGLMPAANRAAMPRLATLLTDANQTINPNTDHCALYVLPSGTLSANRTLTVTNSEGDNSKIIQIVVLDTSAFTYDINNNTPTLLYQKTASRPAAVYQLYHSGGIWGANVHYWCGT